MYNGFHLHDSTGMTLFTLTGNGSNCIKLRTPTGPPFFVSDISFKGMTGKTICITVNLSVLVFNCVIKAG